MDLKPAFIVVENSSSPCCEVCDQPTQPGKFRIVVLIETDQPLVLLPFSLVIEPEKRPFCCRDKCSGIVCFQTRAEALTVVNRYLKKYEEASAGTKMRAIIPFSEEPLDGDSLEAVEALQIANQQLFPGGSSAYVEHWC